MDIDKIREAHKGHKGFTVQVKLDGLQQEWYGYSCPQCDQYEAEWE